MLEDTPRFLVLAGPTASGKSELALEIAARLGGEIVNADSRQVFRHMDIGTAKPSPEERRQVPHHVYDVADPDEHFDTARYRDLARAAVRSIASSRRLAIVVGGTGLYIRTLCRGLFTGPAAHVPLRRALETLEARSPGTLARWCQRLDPAAAARLHRNDVVRLTRAIEVAFLSGERLSTFHERHRFGEPLGASLFVVLDPGREELDRRITLRSRRMFEDHGLVEETRRLWAMGYGPALRPLRSIGYPEAGRVLTGEWDTERAIAELARRTRQFARRQVIWFRSEPETSWLHPERDRLRILELAERFAGEGGLSPVRRSG